MINQLKKIRNTLTQLEIQITLGLIILLLALVIVEVIFRYLRIPLYWAEEVSRYLFVWMVMFGCIVGLEKKMHFRIDFLTTRINNKIFKKALFIFSNFIAIIFLWYMFFKGITLCIRTQGATTPALGIPHFYIYLAIPIASLLMMVHIFIQTYEQIIAERNF